MATDETEWRLLHSVGASSAGIAPSTQGVHAPAMTNGRIVSGSDEESGQGEGDAPRPRDGGETFHPRWSHQTMPNPPMATWKHHSIARMRGVYDREHGKEPDGWIPAPLWGSAANGYPRLIHGFHQGNRPHAPLRPPTKCRKVRNWLRIVMGQAHFLPTGVRPKPSRKAKAKRPQRKTRMDGMDRCGLRRRVGIGPVPFGT